MISEMFTVYDMVAESWLEPFFSPNSATAIRGFQEACELETHQFCKHAEDYALFKVGEFNGATGLVAAHEPARIAMATQFSNQIGGTDA